MRISVNRLVFVICVLVSLVHLFWAAQHLPERMASHFGGGGRADGWSDRGTFLTLYSAMIVGMAILFAGLAVLMPRLPRGAFSIPNPEYWLAPEREALTRRWMGDQMLQIGGATLLFMSATLQATVVANTSEDPRLGAWFWLVFAAYMIFVLVWTVKLLLDTRVPRK